MASNVLTNNDQNIVIFQVWKSLAYPKRMIFSLGLIAFGFWLQLNSYTIFPGIVLLFIGNLFLLVKGYDNRVTVGKFDASATWEKFEAQKLTELEQFDRKIQKWDSSALDATNPLGMFTFFVLLMSIMAIFILSSAYFEFGYYIIGADALVLLVPHWLIGLRTIFTKPVLFQKVMTFKQLLADPEIVPLLKKHTPEVFLLLKGDKTRLPEDVKIRIKINNQHPDFLGFYAQVVMNTVQGKSFPYLYVVLVAKDGYGLREVDGTFKPGNDLTTEFKVEGEVEVFIIRQATTKTSGYHTDRNRIREIFRHGLKLAEQQIAK